MKQELDDSNFPKEFHDQQTNGFGLALVFSLPMAINGPKEVT